MTEESKRSNLGRGLAALLGEDDGEAAAAAAGAQRGQNQAPIERLHPSRVQPRQDFDEEAIDSLAASIKEQGLLQPILVRPHPEQPGEFEIVAGERRWRAAQRAKLHNVPILVRELSDGEALELAIVENVQRQDLNPVEEAYAYRQLIEEFGHIQDQVARVVGKSRSHVANTLRLLNLPQTALNLLRDGALTAGHARAVLAAADPEALAQAIVSEGLTVRQAEQRATAAAETDDAEAQKKKPRGKPEKDADTLALERDLSGQLGLKVLIDHRGQGGSLTVQYSSLEQLDSIVQRLHST